MEAISFDASTPEGQNTNFAETHWKRLCHVANRLLVHARLSNDFTHFALQYPFSINDVIPVKGLPDEDGYPITPFQKWCKRQPKARHYRLFGSAGVYKRYTDEGKGEPQQGKRVIFLGFPN